MRLNNLLTLLLISSTAITGCGGGGGSQGSLTSPAPVSDTIAPVITLLGDTRVEIDEGTSFSDPGATANDNADGTVSVSVSGVVGSEPGTYTLVYSATDSSGNQSQVSREVVVVARDRTPPVISLIGGTTVEIREGEAFEDPGATATDDRDDNVDVTVSGNVGVTPGTYTLTYSATDASGNISEVVRTVEVLARDFDLFTATTEQIVAEMTLEPVSYTHLTLPTICSV